MISFQVDDMTCGHCVSAITKAVHGVDTTARLQFDLATHRVDIEPGEADVIALGGAITEAGYTPVPIERPVSVAAIGATPERKACCCGQGGCA
ncbi:heavy-metal-associated domain-containing protein [Ideonella sp. A 288]|uniref:heavy-metal-associated domain-containing protein n=1 Tax=Ideonella sp. A 288 TaxID=1962181 RepID=UPI000B4C063B|nr:heavy-metal-associated domain-containing protein [Ideonella sp. A 288]